MIKSRRPDEDAVTIGDLREVYRLLLRMEERLAQMHSKLLFLETRMAEDRKRLDAIEALLMSDRSYWGIKQ
jgi:hypothetical protein